MIVCEGRKLSPLKDLKGLHYIAHLLGAPGREFHVLDLVRAVEMPVSAESDNPYSRMTKDELEDEYGLKISDLGDAGEILDSESREVYKREYEKAKQDLAEAERTGCVLLEKEASQTKEFIEKELGRAYGLGGRLRKAASASENARVNVRKAIDAAIKKIEENDSLLGLHLRNTINTGNYCSYTPDRDISWDI